MTPLQGVLCSNLIRGTGYRTGHSRDFIQFFPGKLHDSILIRPMPFLSKSFRFITEETSSHSSYYLVHVPKRRLDWIDKYHSEWIMKYSRFVMNQSLSHTLHVRSLGRICTSLSGRLRFVCPDVRYPQEGFAKLQWQRVDISRQRHAYIKTRNNFMGKFWGRKRILHGCFQITTAIQISCEKEVTLRRKEKWK